METCLEHLAGQASDFIGLADSALVVDGKRLPIHAGVLSQHSAWFRTLFASLKDGLAAYPGGDITLRDFEALELEAFCSFLRCVYSPTPATVRAQLVHIREEGGEVFFDYHVEKLLALAHQFDVALLFDLTEQVVSEEPSCRLALLMDPLRWLLVCDEYQHLGHLTKLRSTAISFLTAKFSALQTDPRLERLSPATLTEVVRMAGYRLSSLAASCGHVQAVQDRAAQRFTATAQQVAAAFCPDVSQAASFVTHWWLNPSSNCIKLSWSQRSDPEHLAQEYHQQPAEAVAQLHAEAGGAQHAEHLELAAEAEEGQGHMQAAAAAAALEPLQPAGQAQALALPVPFGADLASRAQAAMLQQALGHVAIMQQQQAAAGWDDDDALAEAEAVGMVGELAPLLQAAGVFLPQLQLQQAAAVAPAGALPAEGEDDTGAAELPPLHGPAQALLMSQGPALPPGAALWGQWGQQRTGQQAVAMQYHYHHHHHRAARKLRFQPY